MNTTHISDALPSSFPAVLAIAGPSNDATKRPIKVIVFQMFTTYYFQDGSKHTFEISRTEMTREGFIKHMISEGYKRIR